MKKPSKTVVVIAQSASILMAIAVAYLHNVPKTISQEDVSYSRKIVELYGYEWTELIRHEDFEEEIQDIRDIQSAVLQLTPLQQQVPNKQTREPKDLFELRYAQCSDRSRVMDKMLRLAGFKTRVASVYSTAKTGSAWKSLLTTDKDLVRSHSIVEVLTSRGWMIVDTNDAWVGLDKNKQPVDLGQWLDIVEGQGDRDVWDVSNTGQIYWLLEEPYTFVYGLYSRHGEFYPPYNDVPDINWGELLYNTNQIKSFF